MPPSASSANSMEQDADILDSRIPRYQYLSRQQCLDTISLEFKDGLTKDGSGYIIFTDVDEETFHNEFLNPSDREYLNFSWTCFDPALQVLTLEMDTPYHSEMVGEMYNMIMEKIALMNLRRQMHSVMTRLFELDKPGATTRPQSKKRPIQHLVPLRPVPLNPSGPLWSSKSRIQRPGQNLRAM